METEKQNQKHLLLNGICNVNQWAEEKLHNFFVYFWMIGDKKKTNDKVAMKFYGISFFKRIWHPIGFHHFVTYFFWLIHLHTNALLLHDFYTQKQCLSLAKFDRYTIACFLWFPYMKFWNNVFHFIRVIVFTS